MTLLLHAALGGIVVAGIAVGRGQPGIGQTRRRWSGWDGDRKQTRGEAMAVVCRELRDAISKRGDLDGPLRRLERLAEGTAAARDARELRRHLDMKRIPDMDRWWAEMMDLVAHATRIAPELHHLPAD